MKLPEPETWARAIPRSVYSYYNILFLKTEFIYLIDIKNNIQEIYRQKEAQMTADTKRKERKFL